MIYDDLIVIMGMGGGGGAGVNTENKRRSALMDHLCGVDLAPASGVDQADRQAAVWVYAGILAAGAPPGGGNKLMPEQLGFGAILEIF